MPVLHPVYWHWRRVDPYDSFGDSDIEGCHIISERIKCASAAKIEPRVVPVAGQDAVPYSTPVQRKAHVGTPIVYSKRTFFVRENGNCMTTSRYYDATTGLEFLHSPDAHLF